MASRATPTPDKVRVTMADGSQVVLREPRVSGDSLMALEDGKEPHTVALPLEDMRQVEEQRANTLATVGLVSGIVVLTAALAVVVGCAIHGECFTGWN